MQKQITKKINIDPDALEVIGQMKWEENGHVIGRLTCGQLDRKLYMAVNKGLSALGGKWNRKAGGHVFEDDPREQIEALLGNGYLTVIKDGFFETPRAVTMQMLDLLLPPIVAPILEPSAGKGAIADVLREETGTNGRWDICVCESNPKRNEILSTKGYAIVGGDFLEYFPNRRFPIIIMNPPFEEGQDIEHVTHAFERCLSGDGGQLVSVMSAGMKFRTEKKYQAFRNLVDKHGRFVDLPENSFKKSGTSVNTVLVYLRKVA